VGGSSLAAFGLRGALSALRPAATVCLFLLAALRDIRLAGIGEISPNPP
jgi:hypothetical protein